MSGKTQNDNLEDSKCVSDRMPSVIKISSQVFSSNTVFGVVMPIVCHYCTFLDKVSDNKATI